MNLQPTERDTMTCPESDGHGPWKLYGPTIEQEHRRLQSKINPTDKKATPNYDMFDWFLFRILTYGIRHGGQGFRPDTFRQLLVDLTNPEEVAMFNDALKTADALFRSQDLASA